MKYGKLILDKHDFVLIKQYQQLNHTYTDYAHKNTLDILAKRMSKAMIMDAEYIPTDIAQLYAEIMVTCNSQRQKTFSLVAPNEENIKKNKISVISTLGATIIGHSEGDILKYGLPGSTMALTIEKIVPCKKKSHVNISEEVFDSLLPKNYKKN